MKDETLKQPISPAYGDDKNDFNNIIPTTFTTLNILPARLELNNTALTFSNPNDYAQHINYAFIAALQSEWWRGLSELSKSRSSVVMSAGFPSFAN